MKTPTLKLTRLFTLAYSLSLIAMPLAQAGSPSTDAGCQGLGNNGAFGKGLDDRKNDGKDKCGKKCQDELSSMEKKIQEKLNSCQAGVSQSSSFKMADFRFESVSKRLEAAKKAHQNYVKGSEALCKKYGGFSKDVSQNPAADALNEKYSPSSYSSPVNAALAQKKVSEMNAKAKDKYSEFHKDALSNYEKLGSDFPNNKKGGDSLMNGAIDNMKSIMQQRLKYLKEQARQKLAQRKSDEFDPGRTNPEKGAVRFKTQADVDNFYKGLAQCDSALKDLDGFKDKYKKLSDDLADGKKETEEAGAFFADQETKRKNLAKLTAEKTGEMGTGPSTKDTMEKYAKSTSSATFAADHKTPPADSSKFGEVPKAQEANVSEGKPAPKTEAGGSASAFDSKFKEDTNALNQTQQGYNAPVVTSGKPAGPTNPDDPLNGDAYASPATSNSPAKLGTDDSKMAGGHPTALDSDTQSMLDRSEKMPARGYNTYSKPTDETVSIAKPGTAGARGQVNTYRKYCKMIGTYQDCILKPE